jgi:hypothetical protein
MRTWNSVQNATAGSTRALLMVAVCGAGVNGLAAEVHSTSRPSVYGVFVGTSPSGEGVRKLLQIPSHPAPEVIRWKLTLHQDKKTLDPTRYELRCEYGLTAPGEPGLAKRINTLERKGEWTRSKGSRSNAGAVVFNLKGALSLVQIDDNVLHVLNPDRSLMVGDSGWSYSLNRMERAEKPVDPALDRSPDMSYKIAPLATGRTVFGIFEGRSPCTGIAVQLQIPANAACMKAKWRITLYQNPGTLAPTTYRVEGTLYRPAGSEGNWALVRDRGATVYRLTPGSNGPPLYLLEGDDNVLFFLNQKRQPLVGTLDFSYTLNRRME